MRIGKGASVIEYPEEVEEKREEEMLIISAVINAPV